ncbi:hypothetical protein MBLNU459_g6598t1 [Dothideomycetes sp. NU459]
MSAQPCPWLEDLDDDWVQPAALPDAAAFTKPAVSCADDSACSGSVRNGRSRIPTRSSGAYSAASAAHNLDSLGPTKRNRNPLAELSSSAGNAHQDASRSVSVASAASVVRYDTIERKSSPGKQQPTLEWKRRLVHGEVGYGDQTDLFGANGLENIFAAPAKQSPYADKQSLRKPRLFKAHQFPPSSPPPWPSAVDLTAQSTPARSGESAQDHLERVHEDGWGGEEEDVSAVLPRDEEDWQAEEEQDTTEAHGRDGESLSGATESQQCNHGEPQSGSVQDNSENIQLNSSPYSLPVAAGSSVKTAFLHSPNPPHSANRTISGQTDFSGEAFSPVYISKHTTLTGQIDYATMDSHTMRQLERADQSGQDSDRHLDAAPDDGARLMDDVESQLLDDLLEDTLPTVPEVSLPDNLPTGTPPIAALGRYVNLERGGLSAHGSFKNRPLSPSQSETMRSRLNAVQQSQQGSEPDGSVLRGSARPPVNQADSMNRPGTPSKNDTSLLSPPKPRSSASPLKLFGNYDTFTNNRLLRRLSQLEDQDQGAHSQTSVDEESRLDDSQNGSFEQSPPSTTLAQESTSQLDQHHEQRIVSRLSSFGEGELDDHDFEADLSFPTGLDLDEPADLLRSESPPPEVLPPGSRTPFRFHVEESSPAGRQSDNLKRKLSKRSTAKSKASMDLDLSGQDAHHESADVTQCTEGKRPRSSPSKAPTPKRRRTLVALHGELPGMGYGSEIDVKITRPDDVLRRSTDETKITSKPGQNMMRPRNPTPSQRSREEVQAEVEDATLEFLSSSPRLEAIKENLEFSDIPATSPYAEQAKAVAAEVAAFTLNISKAESDGKRNRSITTQDFLDEAMHIMSLIRARGRPRSGLGSVEESDAEDLQEANLRPQDLERSPSPLRVSRPPSREGTSTGWRPRSQMQHDPRVASQLRKFQESDEIDLVETSIRSLRVEEPGEHHFSDEAIIAEGLANIRINGPRPEVNRNRGESDVSRKSGSPTKTHTSHPSIDSSAGGRTIGTSSTRKSDNVATLAPETVAHLIPEEVAGMTFDREKQRWVRLRSSRKRSYETPDPPSNITSDDDPFNEIPDLTVDEVKELTRVHGLHTRSQHSFFDQSPATLRTSLEDKGVTASAETVVARPVTRDNPTAPPFNFSSAHSKYSAFASSRTQAETRATSWSNEELANMARSKQQHSQTTHQMHTATSANIPSTFSDIVENLDEESFSSQDESLQLDDSVTEELPLPAPKQRQHQPWVQSSPGSMYCGAPRQLSLRRQTLNRGFMGAGQDQSEMSFVATLPDKRLVSLSVSVSRPPPKAPGPSQELILPSSSPARVDATFYLSDLPDFTLHNIDEERSSEKVLAKRVAQHLASDRYGMAVQSLVKTLTDVEPDEPYWEDIKQLSLRERGLGSVHNLEDFCSRLEDLDLSSNDVAHLEGAPNSIRRLNVRSNALSSLTAWSHLMNLQYLDISNNSIDNLGGLCMLYHLRELRADDNQISSLDGIMGLDGLLKLSVRRNQLTNVDFDGGQLKHLEDLDLGDNQLVNVSGTNSLPTLTRLIVDHNQLRSFTAADGAYPKLATLSLQNNHLSYLDLSYTSSLRYLNVDFNELSTIAGVESLHMLDVLSMRKQAGPLSLLTSHLHVRSLYLSANTLSEFSLPHVYNTVQILELATCGLQDLPVDFGLKFPNVRSLNLSFNAIKDLRPLLNIPHLETLHAAGNRIVRLRKTAAVLARMEALKQCDLRENPFTLGFYPPSSPANQIPSRDLVPAMALEPAKADDAEEAQLQRRAAASYTLSRTDSTADSDVLRTLDEDTKLRRKVYELLVVNGCLALAELDGLPLDRARVLKKDGVWTRLVELGVLRKTEKTLVGIEA